jgi:curved DNA-binding protein CbpA
MEASLNSLDPYKVFNVPRNFSMEDVKNKYRRLALKLHPDKNANNPVTAQLFQGIHHCYMLLVEEDKKRKADRPFQELRDEARHLAQQQEADRDAGPPAAMMMGKKFNIERFNSLYSEHRIKDAFDDGYGEWMQQVPPEKASERYNDAVQKRELQVQNRGAMPLELVSADTYLLGSTKVKDYSKPVSITGAGSGKGTGLVYTDYKVAHTTSKLISDPNAPFKQYDSIDQLERERANISYTMSEKEAAKVAKAKRKDARREEKRIHAVHERDELMRKQWEKMRMLLTTS